MKENFEGDITFETHYTVARHVDHPATPSMRGEGLPPPPLGWGGEAAGNMVGGGDLAPFS
jgi:hypothetical protein